MKILKKRRRKNKTDYSNRMALLKSRTPRVTFRKTNKYIIGQYIIDKESKDKVEIGVNSKHLIKYGWPENLGGSLKSITASYLTGFLIGKKIIKEKKKTPIVDLGMNRVVYKSKVFSFIKGLVDAGVKIKHDSKTFPEETVIQGKNMEKDFSKTFNEIKSKIEKEDG